MVIGGEANKSWLKAKKEQFKDAKENKRENRPLPAKRPRYTEPRGYQLNSAPLAKLRGVMLPEEDRINLSLDATIAESWDTLRGSV